MAHNTTSTARESPALALLVIAVCLFFAYSSALFIPYAHRDDPSRIVYYSDSYAPDQRITPSQTDNWGMSITAHLKEWDLSIGRPFQYLWQRTLFQFTSTVGDMCWMRFVGLVGAVLFAWTVFISLRQAGWGFHHSLGLALCLGFLPAVQATVSWASANHGVWAAFLGCLAGYLCQRSVPGRHRWLRRILSAVFFLSALLLHQAAGMTFWLVVGIMVFSLPRPDRAELKKLFVMAAVGLLAMAAAFVVHQQGTAYGTSSGFLWMHKSHYTDVSLDAGNISTLLTGRLFSTVFSPYVVFAPLSMMSLDIYLYFATHPMHNGSGLIAHLNPLNQFLQVFSCAFFLTTLIGLYFYFEGSRLRRMLLCVAAMGLLFFSYIPVLLTNVTSINHRMMFAISSLEVFYLFLAACGFYRRFLHRKAPPKWGILLLAIALGAFADYNVARFVVWPQALETGLAHYKLSQPEIQKAKRVVFLQPASVPGVCSDDYYSEEFEEPSSATPIWPQPIVNIFRRDIHPKSPSIPVELKRNIEGPYPPPDPDTAVIDMRDVREMGVK